MKTIAISFICLAALGCSEKSPYDITSGQVQNRIVKKGGPPDMAHLPPGAVRTEKTYKKGDTLPDGTIADAPRKIVTVEVNQGPNGKQ